MYTVVFRIFQYISLSPNHHSNFGLLVFLLELDNPTPVGDLPRIHNSLIKAVNDLVDGTEVYPWQDVV
jgi:hypothetical protein